MTMSGDMSLALHDVINSVLGPKLRAEWNEERFNLEIAEFNDWKGACGLRKQTGWISKRVSVAVVSRAVPCARP